MKKLLIFILFFIIFLKTVKGNEASIDNDEYSDPNPEVLILRKTLENNNNFLEKQKVIIAKMKAKLNHRSPIDISKSIIDSRELISLKHNKFSSVFDARYNLKFKKSEKNNFNKVVVIKPIKYVNIYFSILNYYDIFEKSKIYKNDLLKNYYTIYSKFEFNDANDFYIGFSVGHIPFDENINKSKKNKKGHFTKYAMFFNLDTEFKFNEDAFNLNIIDKTLIDKLYFSNIFGIDVNNLRSNYQFNIDKSNIYAKINDLFLINYELTDYEHIVYGGINLGIFSFNETFLKFIGIKDVFDYKFLFGLKIKYLSLGLNCGNNGFGIDFGLNF